MSKTAEHKISRLERIKNMALDEMVAFLFHVGGCATCSRRNVNDHCDCADVDECKVFIERWLKAKVVERPTNYSMRDGSQITFEEIFGLKNE